MQQTTKQKSRLAQNRQFWQKSWMYPELSNYLSVSKNNLNNLPAFGIDGKTRSPTCKMKSNAWFSHSCANKMTFHILFFAHISVILYVTIFKSEETRARERSRPLRKCRRVCLLKGVSPRPGRKNIACFFQRKERRHAQQNTRGHFRTRCMWHPTDREEKNKNAIQHSYKKKERLCCPPLANAHKLTTVTIPCCPNS